MTINKGTKLVIALGSTCFLWLVAMLVFRAYFYADMYIAPEDPYGISDIIEYLMWLVFVALLGLSSFASVVLFIKGKSQTKKAAIGLVIFCIILFFSLYPLHHIAARWHT